MLPVWQKLKNAFCAAVFAAAFFVGSACVQVSLGAKDGTLENAARANAVVSLSGVVTDISYTKTSNRQKIILKSEGLKVQAILDDGEKTVLLGDVLTLEGALESFEPRRNPGGFDEFIFMRSRKVDYKMPKAVITAENGRLIGSAVILGGFRDKLAEVYDELLPPQEAGIAKSVVLGDKSGLDEDILRLYQYAGVYHILVISGLHVSVISLIVLTISSFIFGRKIGGVLTILVLVGYCLMTGCGVSTVRAVLMFAVVIAGRMISRENDPTVCTAFACCCLLIYEPLYLFDIGFQYSFLAVFGIVTMTKPMERAFILLGMRYTHLSGLARSKWIKDYLLATLAATLATTPVLAYHFFYLLPYNLFANLVILPSSSLMIGSAAVICLVGLINLTLAGFLSGTLYILLKFYEITCAFFVGLPGAVILIGQPPLFIVALWCLCCVLLAVMLSGKLNKIAPRLKILSLCIALMVICQISWRHVFQTETELTILDVSGGNCVVVHNNAKTYMVDCGGFYNADERNNSGIKTIAPYLNYKGIKKLDGFFSTYSDQDYQFNLAGLMSQKVVENIFLPESVDSEGLFGFDGLGAETGTDTVALSDSPVAPAIPVHKIYPGDTVRDGGFSFTCLTSRGTFLFSCNGVNILLIGEKDQNGGREILDALGEKSRDIHIVKLAANSAANADFVREISPRVLAACNGRYAFKWISETNESLAAGMEIPLFDTADNGAVIVKISEERDGVAGFSVHTMK